MPLRDVRGYTRRSIRQGTPAVIRNGFGRNQERAALVRLIEGEVRETAAYTGRPALSAAVLQAMTAVAREDFVPEIAADRAYANIPLPIGHQQTISQPYIVALMTDLLDPEPDHVVLEVGTGSGYQAAVLSTLVRHVYSVEVIEELATAAGERLRRLGYGNVSVCHGDGNLGWPEHAPYDGVIVTAGAPAIPAALLDQLKPGRPLVIPVDDGWHQTLKRVTVDARGNLSVKDVLPVAFVPLVPGAED